MKVTPTKFRDAIKSFTDDQGANQRYASFDYCYSYFRSFKDKRDLASATHLQQSCLALGFYLASWGMFRGSSFLLQRSVRSFGPLINWIATCDPELWRIDVSGYGNADSRNKLLEAYAAIRTHLGGEETNPSKTLITKVMLGVFANIPAFDQFVCKAFQMHTVNEKNLRWLHEFYTQNQALVDAVRIKCFAFRSGKQTGPLYSKAKVIDMYGFIAGNGE